MVSRDALEKVVKEDMAGIWNVLTSEEKRVVIDNFTIHNYKRNQIIYAEKEGIGGRQQIIRLIRPIQYFGHRAYFANEPYVSGAIAMEPSVVGTIPMKIVEELIDGNRQLAWFFIHELSHNLGRSDTKIVNLTQKHIRGRLAEALVVLIDNYGFEEDGETLNIYMSREDLANLSNMTTSNAIRTLSSFVNEHVIVVDGRRIKVLNEPILRKISKFG